MASKAQSWRSMTAIARLYIGTVIVVGTCVLVGGGLRWQTQLPFKFVSYLVVAVLASRLKVNLPGITGTMSVNFLFILLGVLELSFGETLVLGAAAILTQCFYRDRPNIVQVLFNICATSCAIAASYGVYHMPSLLHVQYNNPAVLLVGTACTYFVANTVPVAGVIALTEHKSIKNIWSDAYFWSFPYYLVGAGVAGLVSWLNRIV